MKKFNERKKQIIENTTVLVPGHNVKDFAVVAIESLLLVSDFKREQIVYFDDFSTDGSVEELTKRGIKCITWLDEDYKAFSEDEGVNTNLPARVSAILNSGYKQIDTEYVFVVDSDDVFINDPTEFIFDYLLPRSGDECIMFGFLGRHKEPDVEEEMFKIYQNFMYLNKRELEKLNCLGDDLEYYKECPDINSEFIFDSIDTGCSFYKKVKDLNNVAFVKMVDYMYIDIFDKEICIHLGWISSSMRDDPTAMLTKEDVVDSLHVLNSTDATNVLNKIGVSKEILLDSILKKYKKSDIV